MPHNGVVTPFECIMGDILIDTIGLKIPLCGESSVAAVTSALEIVSRSDGETGEIFSSFTRGSLAGSWDSRISAAIRDREYVWMVDEQAHNGGRTVQVVCAPYLYCEFSLQKYLYGINCFNYAWSTALDGLYHFAEFLMGYLGPLPPVETWEIERLDLGYVTRFPDDETMGQYLEFLKRIEYPRRKMRSIVYQSSVMWVGSGQSFKLYSKRSEFRAHDRKRLLQFFADRGVADMITDSLDGVLRVELSMRKNVLRRRGIKYIFDLFDLAEPEKMIAAQMEKIGLAKKQVRIWTAAEVRALLQSVVVPGSKISADAAFAVWVDWVVSGSSAARARAGSNKYARAKRIFRDYGITTATNLSESEQVPHPTELRVCSDTRVLSYLSAHNVNLPYFDLAA